MAVALKFGKDSQGYNAFAPRPATNMKSIELINSTAQSFTVPNTEDFWTVSFRYQPGTTVWVDVTGATAAEPVGNTWADTTSEMNPATLVLAGNTNVSMISGNDTADVGVVMWQYGGP